MATITTKAVAPGLRRLRVTTMPISPTAVAAGRTPIEAATIVPSAISDRWSGSSASRSGSTASSMPPRRNGSPIQAIHIVVKATAKRRPPSAWRAASAMTTTKESIDPPRARLRTANPARARPLRRAALMSRRVLRLANTRASSVFDGERRFRRAFTTGGPQVSARRQTASVRSQSSCSSLISRAPTASRKVCSRLRPSRTSSIGPDATTRPACTMAT